MTQPPQTDPFDGYDLGEYRYAVARFVRLLIRARAKTTPRFLTPEQYARWELENIADDAWTQEQLLVTAGGAYEHLWRVFIGPHGSGGVAPDDPLSRLKEYVVHFLSETSPSELIDKLRQGKKINWKQAAAWDTLSEIRDGLDSLPHPHAGETGREPACPATIKDEKKGDVEVQGVPKRLTFSRLNVVKALVDVYPATLTKDQLIDRSGHSDAVKILKRLTSDPAWAPIIKLAGTTGGGYGIVRPETG